MIKPVLMPQIGQDIATGRIVAWLAREGQRINKGAVIAQVESEKAVFDLEACESGVLLKILVPEDGEGKVLEPIAYIGEPGELISSASMSASIATSNSDMKIDPEVDTVHDSNIETDIVSPRSQPFASPAARRMASERGIDLATLHGSGPAGRIIARDIPEAAR